MWRDLLNLSSQSGLNRAFTEGIVPLLFRFWVESSSVPLLLFLAIFTYLILIFIFDLYLSNYFSNWTSYVE